MKTTIEEKKLVRERLLKWLKPGNTVYTVLNHVSQSGIMRHISLYVFKHNKPICLDWNVSQLLERPLAKSKGVKAQGCGMDMGFELVYSLSYALFKDGYRLSHRWL